MCPGAIKEWLTALGREEQGLELNKIDAYRCAKLFLEHIHAPAAADKLELAGDEAAGIVGDHRRDR